MTTTSPQTSRRFAHTEWGTARRKAVMILSATMLVEILLQLIPAIQSLLLSSAATEESQLNRWVYIMLLAGIMQIGLLIYMLLFVVFLVTIFSPDKQCCLESVTDTTVAPKTPFDSSSLSQHYQLCTGTNTSIA